MSDPLPVDVAPDPSVLDGALRAMLETCPVPQSLYDLIEALPEGDAA